MRKRRRGETGFDRRKDHRRASEISMESVADKVLKEDDDAQVEVSDTALMQDDDEGSDYNIDEYLDATSKLLYFAFTIL